MSSWPCSLPAVSRPSVLRPALRPLLQRPSPFQILASFIVSINVIIGISVDIVAVVLSIVLSIVLSRASSIVLYSSLSSVPRCLPLWMWAVAVALASLAGGYITARTRVDLVLLEQLQAAPHVANKVRPTAPHRTAPHCTRLHVPRRP